MGACRSATPPVATNEDGTITVASFNFPESEVVAEIYAGALEEAGFRVDRAFALGARELVLPALQRGLVEVVPEYSGSAVSFLGQTPSSVPSRTHALLRSLLLDRGILALGPAEAQNRNEFVVSGETARRFSLNEISDLAPYAGTMTIGGPPECRERPLCIPGLRATYGLEFDSFIELDGGGPLTSEAIERGTVDVGLLFTTDAGLRAGDLVALDDDRGLQPAENLTPLVRSDVITSFGQGVVDTLERVSASLTTDDLRQMNEEILSGGSPAGVARAWLESHTLSTDPATPTS